MCSTPDGPLARIRSAIDELAAAAAAGGDADGQHIAERLARVWAMMADIDPELARRLAGYRS